MWRRLFTFCCSDCQRQPQSSRLFKISLDADKAVLLNWTAESGLEMLQPAHICKNCKIMTACVSHNAVCAKQPTGKVISSLWTICNAARSLIHAHFTTANEHVKKYIRLTSNPQLGGWYQAPKWEQRAMLSGTARIVVCYELYNYKQF